MANEGVIQRFCKCQEIENKEKDQYKEVTRTLNTKLTAKLALLEKETRRRKELKKMTTNLATELATLREWMEKAKADILGKFCISQQFYDEYDVYHYDDFDDCLNLSQVVINNTILLTPNGTDAISDETDDSVHTIKEVVKDPDVEVIV